MATCTGCAIDRDEAEFEYSWVSPSGVLYRGLCRQCLLDGTEESAAAKLRWIGIYKVLHGCVACGTRIDAEALAIDGVSADDTWKQLLQGARLATVVCGNCEEAA